MFDKIFSLEHAEFDARNISLPRFAGSIEQLKKLTEQEIERLSRQKYTIDAAHSNLDLLIKRYSLSQSYIGRLTQWYGSCPWWAKFLLLLLFAAIGASIGTFCGLPLILTIVTSVIYIFFAYFFLNHYQVTQKQIKSLSEDILELEKNLIVTINHFNKLSLDLKKILENLHLMNNNMLEEILAIEKIIKNLSSRLNEYEGVIQQLEEAKSTLVAATTKISTDLNKVSEHFKETYKLIDSRSDIISKIYDEAKVNRFRKKEEQLHIVAKKYHAVTLRLSSMSEKMEAIYNDIQEKLAYKTKPQDKTSKDLIDKADKLMAEARDVMRDVSNFTHDDESEIKSNRILEKARQARMTSAAVRNRLTPSSNFLQIV